MITVKKRAVPLPPAQLILVPVKEKTTSQRRIPRKLFRAVAVVLAFFVLLMTGGVGATVTQPAEASVAASVPAVLPAVCIDLGFVSYCNENVSNPGSAFLDLIKDNTPDPIKDVFDNIVPDGGLSGLADIVTAPVDNIKDTICMYTPAPTEETQWTYDAWPGKAQVMGEIAGTATAIDGSLGAGGLLGVVAVGGLIGKSQDGKINVSDNYVATGTPASALDWYGTSGLQWKTVNYEETGGQCAVASLPKVTMGIVTSNIWTFITTVGSWGSTLFYYASVPNALDPLLGPGGPIDTILRNSLDQVFIPFLWPMMLIVALWVAWKGLVKKRSSESIQGVVWVVLAAASAMFFMAQPVLVMSKLNTVVSAVTSVVINAIDVSPAGNTGWCSINQLEMTPEKRAQLNQEINDQLGAIDGSTGQPWDPATRQAVVNDYYSQYEARAMRYVNIRESQCSMWQAFLFTPWAAGQFGSAADQVLIWPETGQPISDTNGNPVNAEGVAVPLGSPDDMTVTVAGKQLEGQSGSTFAVVQLDSSTLNHDDVNALNAGNLDPAVIQKKARQQFLIYQNMEYYWKAGNQPAESTAVTASDAAAYRDIVEIWSGNDPSTRVSAAILALLAMIIAAGPIFFMTFTLLIYQLAMVILLLVAPLFLTVGIHPGFGRKVALGWVEQILNLSLKRIGVAVIIAVMLVMFNVIFLMPAPLIMQVFMMAALGIAVLAFRKRIMNMIARVNLDGDGINNVDDAIRQKSKQAGAAAVGAVVGGTTAAVGGAGAMGIAQAAGSSGGAGLATGSPKAALTTGLGTGIAAGNKGRADTERKEELADQQRAKEEDARQDQAVIELLDWLRANGGTREELRDVREIAAQLGFEQAVVEGKRIAAQHQDGGTIPVPETTTGTGESAGTAMPVEDTAVLEELKNTDPERYARREALENDPASVHSFTQSAILEAVRQQNSGNPLSPELESRIVDAMDYSTSNQAPIWIHYYQQTQSPVPEPQDKGLREALESAGVQFRAAAERISSQGQQATANPSVVPVVAPAVQAPNQVPPTRPNASPTNTSTPNLDV